MLLPVRVARSAPPMRGLRPKINFSETLRVCNGRAIRPAYEGIETDILTEVVDAYLVGRAIRPAYEGIETRPSGRAKDPASHGSRDPPRL